MPWSRALIAATAGAFSFVTAKPGRTATARSMNRRTAAYCPSATGSTCRWSPPWLQALEAAEVARVGRRRQAGDRVLLLARDVEDRPARDEHLDVRRGAQQVGDDRGGRDDLLEVVEDEQEALVAQPVGERIRRSAGRRSRRARPTAGDPGRDEHRVADRLERHEEDAVGEVVRRTRRELRATAGSCRSRPARSGSAAGSSPGAPAASSSSASRPMNVVSWVGRLFGRASSVRSGGKLDGRPSASTWKMRTGAPRSLSRCSPRSRSVTPVDRVVPEQLAGRSRTPGSGRRGRPPRSGPPG